MLKIWVKEVQKLFSSSSSTLEEKHIDGCACCRPANSSSRAGSQGSVLWLLMGEIPSSPSLVVYWTAMPCTSHYFKVHTKQHSIAVHFTGSTLLCLKWNSVDTHLPMHLLHNTAFQCQTLQLTVSIWPNTILLCSRGSGQTIQQLICEDTLDFLFSK